MTAIPITSNRAALPAVRRRHALQLLWRDGSVSCQDLRALFDISEATARRDIDSLVKRGHAVRVYGGAVLPELPAPKPTHLGYGNVASR